MQYFIAYTGSEFGTMDCKNVFRNSPCLSLPFSVRIARKWLVWLSAAMIHCVDPARLLFVVVFAAAAGAARRERR